MAGQAAKKNKKTTARKTASTAKKKEEEKNLKVVKKTEAKAEKEEKKEATPTTAPTTDCKVFGSPDPDRKKCKNCKDLDACLLLESKTKKSKKKAKPKEVRGRDFAGFLKDSKKSQFALTIAKKPCTMADIKQAPWNKPTVQTFYDTFNQMNRHKTEDGKDLPLADRNKEGRMFIVEKNLTKAQKEQMKAEVESFKL